MRILFDSKNSDFKTPFGTLLPGEKCDLRIHIPKHCRTRTVRLCVNREDGGEYASFFMGKERETKQYEIFHCAFSLPEPGLFFYFFRIETENESFSLYRQGFDQTNMEEGEFWQVSCIPHSFQVPEAYAGKPMYQIFPDRFHQKGACDAAGKLTPFSLHKNKTDVPDFRPDENGEVLNCDFFGGNLAGIEEKLDYLRDLGIFVIYLNPIFKAWSNHRYDTCDYKKIDELLGTEADFSRLCHAAHQRGMKIILDGVFSHTGSNSIYFDEKGLFGNGALHHTDSPYRSWFDFHGEGGEYTSWWGIKTLPCVREMDPGFLEYIIDGEDSVIAHWLRAGADGFRLDVADELPDAFIRRLRARIKQIRPDALLIGEVWEDASNKSSYQERRTYFTEGELDSVMNYPFRKAILDFVTGKDGGISFRNTVMDLAENYPPQVLLTLMNMLSTHDTPRILSLLSPTPAPEEKEARAGYRMGAEEETVARARYEVALLLQFVLPGMPCIYYGDEIGMQGWEDPFCRGYFEWERVKTDPILAHVRTLSRLRGTLSVLQKGSLRVLTDGQGRLAVEREKDGVVCRALVNMGAACESPFSGEILLSGGASQKDGILCLKTGGYCLELVKKEV